MNYPAIAPICPQLLPSLGPSMFRVQANSCSSAHLTHRQLLLLLAYIITHVSVSACRAPCRCFTSSVSIPVYCHASRLWFHTQVYVACGPLHSTLLDMAACVRWLCTSAGRQVVGEARVAQALLSPQLVVPTPPQDQRRSAWAWAPACHTLGALGEIPGGWFTDWQSTPGAFLCVIVSCGLKVFRHSMYQQGNLHLQCVPLYVSCHYMDGEGLTRREVTWVTLRRQGWWCNISVVR